MIDFNAGAAIPCFKLLFIMAPIGILMWFMMSNLVDTITSYAYATRLKIEQMYSVTNATKI